MLKVILKCGSFKVRMVTTSFNVAFHGGYGIPIQMMNGVLSRML